jgi:protoporphyrin/coproporphyrin ferrochelatase
MNYDAVLVLSFGGPEAREDVMPFLQNVLRGRNVPQERMLEVAEHYYHFGGRSPINQQNRELIAALETELEQHGPQLPVYWGNRNWEPYLADTLRQMKDDGVTKALAYVTSAFSSYSGCRQYREDILAAQGKVGEGAPQVDKLRVFYNHPGFIGPLTENVQTALLKLPANVREQAQVIYTAHSIPTSMAQGSRYVPQLEEACRLISGALGRTGDTLAYQSRSGPPTQPWLEPDILDYLRTVKESNSHPAVVICPVGFTSDHMEVLYDLDVEAQELCAELRLPMIRAATVGSHPRFITMIRELINERMDPTAPRRALGNMGPSLDVCPVDCCPAPQRPATAGRPGA